MSAPMSPDPAKGNQAGAVPAALGLQSSNSTDQLRRPQTSARKRVMSSDTLLIFLVLVVLCAAFAIARPGQFASIFNLRNVVTDGATLLVMAVGMTYVIITAGIDLSVGSVLVFSGVIAAKVIVGIGGEDAGWGAIAIGGVAGVIAGLAWGIVNGVLIARLRLPALIVTLGTMGAALGASQLLTNTKTLKS